MATYPSQQGSQQVAGGGFTFACIAGMFTFFTLDGWASPLAGIIPATVFAIILVMTVWWESRRVRQRSSSVVILPVGRDVHHARATSQFDLRRASGPTPVAGRKQLSRRSSDKED